MSSSLQNTFDVLSITPLETMARIAKRNQTKPNQPNERSERASDRTTEQANSQPSTKLCFLCFIGTEQKEHYVTNTFEEKSDITF